MQRKSLDAWVGIFVLLGVLFCSSLLVIAVNVLVDLLHAALDPRIRVR